jgi:hypothetical protein
MLYSNNDPLIWISFDLDFVPHLQIDSISLSELNRLKIAPLQKLWVRFLLSERPIPYEM